MKNILVATDFSIKSFNAMSLAKRLATKSNGKIHLIHVVEPILFNYTSTGELLDDDLNDVFTLKLVESVTEKLDTLKKSYDDQSLEIEGKIKIGNPFIEIKNYINNHDIDLVILGSHGVNDDEEFFLGSLTDKLVRSLKCPVIAVKELVDDDEFKNIVYATDLTEEHEPMLKLLKEFQSLFDSILHIVKINTRKKFKNDIETHLALRKLVDKYSIENYTLNIYNHEDEEYGIVYFADDKKADLIAIGIHEKSGFRRIISGGSIADEVSDHTYRPVLTLQFTNDD